MIVKNFKEDDYLASTHYQDKAKSDNYPEFCIFSRDGQFYFGLNDSNGKIVLRSEGYATEAARNKGIESVLKNKTDINRWLVSEKMGYFFLVLKAGNHQEIGRSSWFKSKEEAESTLNAYLTSGIMKIATVNEVYSIDDPIQKQDILKAEDKEDDYLSCDEYKGHIVNDKENNVSLFKHENGQFYFALYDANGNVKIRSEGFETAKNRDQELSGVLKFHNDESMYSMLQKGKYFMMVLHDKNGTEVGRSCLQKTEEQVKAANLTDGNSRAKVVSTRVTNTRREYAIEDDYLKCEAYKGQPVSDTVNNVALFIGGDEQLYFAIYNLDGSVRLRSEGFKTEEGRNNELKAALENMNNPDMYAVIKKGKYSIKVLKDSLGREVARSCMYLDV